MRFPESRLNYFKEAGALPAKALRGLSKSFQFRNPLNNISRETAILATIAIPLIAACGSVVPGQESSPRLDPTMTIPPLPTIVAKPTITFEPVATPLPLTKQELIFAQRLNAQEQIIIKSHINPDYLASFNIGPDPKEDGIAWFWLAKYRNGHLQNSAQIGNNNDPQMISVDIRYKEEIPIEAQLILKLDPLANGSTKSFKDGQTRYTKDNFKARAAQIFRLENIDWNNSRNLQAASLSNSSLDPIKYSGFATSYNGEKLNVTISANGVVTLRINNLYMSPFQ
ncbi:hypothetical protein HY025_05860 [Candidatus Daviesbacteria bacterium]|nr:hypothetical protein [Candidatus Daviesbacteria bacterium]